MIDIKAIRAAAEAATKGEWKAVEKCNADPNEGTHFIMCHGVLGYWRGGKGYHTDDTWVLDKADAIHIATVNPTTVIALLDRLEAAEKDAARYVWWRDTACRNPSHVMRLLTPCIYSVEIDDAIDAAMKDGQK